MEKGKISYYVVIPMPIFEDKDLSPTEKLLYGLITALVTDRGYCFASNSYLAEKMNLHEVSVSKTLKKLEKKSYIKLVYLKEGSVVKNRKIYLDERLAKTLTDTISENAKTTISANAKERYKAIKGSNKYIKEINKESFFLNKNLDETFKKYLIMRCEKKCKATETTMESLVKKLNKYNIEIAIKMLEYSIDNGYQGVFELKNNNQNIKKQKDKPNWFDSKLEENTATDEEIEKMEKMLEEFNV